MFDFKYIKNLYCLKIYRKNLEFFLDLDKFPFSGG